MRCEIRTRNVVARCIAAICLFAIPAVAWAAADTSSPADIANAQAAVQPRTDVAAIDPTVDALPLSVPEPFALQTERVPAGALWSKWAGVEAQIGLDRAILARCRASRELCPAAATRFEAVINAGRTRTGRARIGAINRAVNMAIRPTSDMAQFGVPDRWSTPLATFASGRGDCEDYAIAKFVALQEAGVAASDLRLVIVHDMAVNEDHALVAARLEDRWVMLDNRHLALVADTDMRRVVPRFVLGQGEVKQFAPTAAADRSVPGGAPALGPALASAANGL